MPTTLIVLIAAVVVIVAIIVIAAYFTMREPEDTAVYDTEHHERYETTPAFRDTDTAEFQRLEETRDYWRQRSINIRAAIIVDQAETEQFIQSGALSSTPWLLKGKPA